MRNNLSLRFTLNSETPEYVLGVLGWLWCMQNELAEVEARGLTEGFTIKSMDENFAAGFTVGVASVDSDGQLVINRDMPLRPALFNVPNWSNLLNGLQFKSNMFDLGENPTGEPIVFEAEGVNEIEDIEGYLALFRFVNEHLLPNDELHTVMTWSDVDPEVPGNYVIFKQGGSIGYVKNVGDIDQPLDIRWDLEKLYSSNNEILMRHFVGKIANITRETTAQIKLGKGNTSLFITQTGINKMLIAYWDLVTRAVDDPEAGLNPAILGIEAETYTIDAGLVHVLSGVMALGLDRILKSGTGMVPVRNSRGKLPFGNVSKLRSFQLDLDLLFPYASQNRIATTLESYLSHY